MSVDLEEGYQPGIHWPYCIDRLCSGCMPELPPIMEQYESDQTGLDLSIFRED